jgi:hypothetical protein
MVITLAGSVDAFHAEYPETKGLQTVGTGHNPIPVQCLTEPRVV